MRDFLAPFGITICIVALVLLAMWGGLKFIVHLSTVEGNFVVIPETGQPFEVRKVIFMSSNAVVYTKHDGTGGRISGNFRVEDAPSKIEKNQDK
jgi:hypothetical protein